jgi:hypothetical protein
MEQNPILDANTHPLNYNSLVRSQNYILLANMIKSQILIQLIKRKITSDFQDNIFWYMPCSPCNRSVSHLL